MPLLTKDPPIIFMHMNTPSQPNRMSPVIRCQIPLHQPWLYRGYVFLRGGQIISPFFLKNQISHPDLERPPTRIPMPNPQVARFSKSLAEAVQALASKASDLLAKAVHPGPSVARGPLPLCVRGEGVPSQQRAPFYRLGIPIDFHDFMGLVPPQNSIRPLCTASSFSAHRRLDPSRAEAIPPEPFWGVQQNSTPPEGGGGVQQGPGSKSTPPAGNSRPRPSAPLPSRPPCKPSRRFPPPSTLSSNPLWPSLDPNPSPPPRPP